MTIPSILFRQGVWLRGQLYDRGIIPAAQVSCPVISVGNITVGGTGKTPFSIWLLQRLQTLGLNAGFVSRGYGSNGRDVREVTGVDAHAFGDEPSLVRARFPTLPIFVGPDRPKAISALLNKSAVDVVVADDAFQHRRLRRNLDIVLLDALEPRWHYEFLPRGRARESFEALARAQFVVLSKANLASIESLGFLEEKLAGFSGHRLKMNYLSGGFSKLDEFAGRLNGRIFLVTGVGRPESVRRLLNDSVVQHKIYPDHHDFSTTDVADILRDFERSGAQNLVSTAKDAVKLRQHPELARRLWQLDLKIDVQGDLDALDRQILGMVRARS